MPGDVEALGLIEIDGMPRAMRAQDRALKRAPVTVLCCAAVSPGKALLIFGGEVASVEEALAEALAVVAERRIDHLFLPGVHPSVVAALTGARTSRGKQALGIVEVESVATTVTACDTAMKAAEVSLGRLHLATGFGGRGFFTVWGAQDQVESAVAAALDNAGEGALDHEVIPAPHDELEQGAFVRPWPLDPCDGGGS